MLQPRTQRLDQQVLTSSRAQAALAHARGEEPAFLEWVSEGRAASTYEPQWWPKNPITPDPYHHLALRQGVVTNEHNNIHGAMGVQSTAIPWDYRHYSGRFNTHRKAEPLLYTPLFIAKDHDGNSAIDLTSVMNRKYQYQRMSSNPQYVNTLSALTDYKPVKLAPTDFWLPQMPVETSPGVKNQKFWEAHFLDLYAPTPPPLLSPKAPQMRQAPQAASLLEMQHVDLPDILQHGERVHSIITPVQDMNGNAVPFHDLDAEADSLMHSRELTMAPAGVFLELDEEAVEDMDAETAHAALLDIEAHKLDIEEALDAHADHVEQQDELLHAGHDDFPAVFLEMGQPEVQLQQLLEDIDADVSVPPGREQEFDW